MNIPETHMNTTAFLCVEQDAGARVVPRATAFFVIDRSGPEPPVWVVTARHCIENARATGRPVFLRVNTKDSCIDCPTDPDDWLVSDVADVAAALWLGPKDCTITSVPLDQFIGADYRYRASMDMPGLPKELSELVGVGHEVFFVGLFSQHAGKTRNLPIVRFGNVSRPPSEPIALKLSDDPQDETVTNVDGWLVEARSLGGHSGSPAFWYWPNPQAVFIPDPRVQTMDRPQRRRLGLTAESQIPVSREYGILALLGLVTAHFDIERDARTPGDEFFGRVVTSVNAGIAVITPAHFIRELIQGENATEQVEKHLPRRSPELAATLDMYDPARSEKDSA